MPIFWYSGRDRNGAKVEAEREATNADALLLRLQEDEIIPLQIEERSPSIQSTSATIKWPWQAAKTIPLVDLIMFSRQMFSLMKSGVPILRAMAGLADSAHRPQLKSTLHEVGDDLSAGNELAVALGKHPDIFSALYISLIHVGENTGRLDLAFEQIAKYLEIEFITRQRISSAMRYPIIVLVVMAIAMVIMNIFVIPAFSGLFAAFNGELPLPTQLIIATSNFFVAMWPLLLLATIVGIITLQRWIKTERGKLQWDGWKIRWPIIGKIFYEATLARFARAFATCQRAGVPISVAMGIVANAVDNAYIGDKIRAMREGIERGESISKTAQHSALFSPLVMQMLIVGEETGQIDQLMDEVADFYEREVDYNLRTLSDAIQPILIIALGAMVLVLALGIFLPMWKLASVARGG